MKTNRRGFFGALAGLAGGVYAAFVPNKKVALGKFKVDSWKLPSEAKPQKVEFEDFIPYEARIKREKPKIAYIHLTSTSGSTDSGFTYTVYGRTDGEEAIPLFMNDGNKSYRLVPNEDSP